MNEEDKKDCLKSLIEAFKFGKERYLIWLNAVITLCSTIVAFAATDLLDAPYVHNKAFVYAGLMIIASAVILGLYGTKRIIELEMNSASGEFNRQTGRSLSSTQEKALQEVARIEGKTSSLSDYLFWMFCGGLFSLALSLISFRKICMH